MRNMCLREFIHYMIEVASGQLVNHEKNDFRELAIFKSGVTL
nr:UxaA family hydrolase [Bacillus subtilis]